MEKQIVSIIVTLFVVGFVFNAQGKVEKILKGSLDSIPSPSRMVDSVPIRHTISIL